MGLFDEVHYTEEDYERMWHTSLITMKQTETQKEIARRLERREDPQSIADQMGIPISHVTLLKK